MGSPGLVCLGPLSHRPPRSPAAARSGVPAQNERLAPFTRSIQVPSDYYFLHVCI